jgi:hypothetical protein
MLSCEANGSGRTIARESLRDAIRESESVQSPNRAQPSERGSETAFPMAREAATRKPARRPH